MEKKTTDILTADEIQEICGRSAIFLEYYRYARAVEEEMRNPSAERDVEKVVYQQQAKVRAIEDDLRKQLPEKKFYSSLRTAFELEGRSRDFNTVTFAREMVGIKKTGTAGDNLKAAMAAAATRMGKTSSPDEALTFATQMVQHIGEAMGYENLAEAAQNGSAGNLSYSIARLPSSSQYQIRLRTLSAEDAAKQAAYDLFAVSCRLEDGKPQPRTEEDLAALLKLADQAPLARRDRKAVAQENEPAPAAEESWVSRTARNPLLQGAAGVALAVAPEFLPPPAKDENGNEKMSFYKVLRTTLTVVLPIAGFYLITRAVMGNNWSERTENQAQQRSGGWFSLN